MKQLHYFLLFLACWLNIEANGQNSQQNLLHLYERYDVAGIIGAHKQHMTVRKKVITSDAESMTQNKSLQDPLFRFKMFDAVNEYVVSKQRTFLQSTSEIKSGKLITNLGVPKFIVEVGNYSEEFQFIHTQDTRQASDAYRPSDWPWENSPNDVFYRFTLEKPMELLFVLNSGNAYLLEEEAETGRLVPVSSVNVIATRIYHANLLGATTYYIVSEGVVDDNGVVFNGEIRVGILAKPLNSVVTELDTLSNDTSFVITGDTRKTLNEYGGIYNDLFYKFELNHYMDFSVSRLNIGLSQACIYLLDDKKELVSSSRDFKLDSKQLPAGIYYLVVEGIFENGLISLTIEAKSPDKVLFDIGSYLKFFSYQNTQDTRLTPNAYHPSDWLWDNSPNDVFYRFTLETPMAILAAVTSGTGAVYCLEEDINTGLLTPIAWLDTLSGIQGVYLASGTYNIISEGVVDNNGVAHNEEITTAIVGFPSRYEVYLGTFSNNTSKDITGDTRRTSSEYGDPFRNDIYYSFELIRPMDIFVSLNKENLINVNLYLLDQFGKEIASSKNGDLSAKQLFTGSYYLVVEGRYDDGVFSVNLELEPQEIVIDLGRVSGAKNFSETFNTANSENRFGLSANEIFYKLQLTRKMDISVSNYSSSNSTDVKYATAIYLLDTDENIIKSSQDGRTGFSIKNLSSGIYYIVSEGKTQNVNITTNIATTYQKLDPNISNHNYIITHTYTESDGSDSRTGIDYYDGLGRSSGTTLVGASPLGSDIVTRQDYDCFGRPSRGWLPRESSYSNGKYLTVTEFEGMSLDLYNNDTHPYAMTVYENSPLNRILEQYGPGQQWQQSGHSVKSSYLTNASGVDTLNCIHFTATNMGDTIMKINRIGNYNSGQLFVTRMQDEDGHALFQFRDKLGYVLLTRQVVLAGTVKELCDTYYIYDDFNNQVAVLPPELSNAFRSGTSSRMTSADSGLRNYAYLYQYDFRNRCIAKKLPGCEWLLYVYDKADRLILSQDGNLRQTGQWLFSLPDDFGRVVLTGICNKQLCYSAGPLSSTVVKAVRNNATDSSKGYSLSGIDLENQRILSVNYYDDYDFMGKNGIPDSTDINIRYDKEIAHEGYGERYVISSKGLLTGTLTVQLDELSLQPSFLYLVIYYDNQSRMIQAKSNNQLEGGINKEYIAYNFVGQPVKKKYVHSSTGNSTQTEIYSYAYDHAGRLLTTTHQLNDSSPITLVSNSYDQLGRLISNRRNGNPNLKTEYTYNVRSWITSISGLLFSESLYYNDRRSNSTNISCYNGNISGIDWKVPNDNVRGYNFSYDNLSRLIDASYLEGDMFSDKFSTSYSYDKHGNILSLRRSGNLGITTYGVVDDLILSYEGNQLLRVEDKGTNPSLSMSMDFKDSSHESVEYGYDQNGNMVKDLNKQISKIEYNYLNLPKYVTFSAESNPMNKYVYSAGGKKLSVIHKSSIEKRSDYVGNVIYENGSLKRILVDGGYIENGIYHFYIQDHLGSNRVVAKSDGTAVQTTHYYPYGMSFAEGTFADKQPYKYNGKELDTENGLNLYDYDARQMDIICDRFTSVDPMAEKYFGWSPYVYCANNPLRYIDPSGLAWKPTYNTDHDGRTTYNGYEWIPEEDSYNEDGSLKKGLYAQAIFFSDNGTFDPSKKKNMGSSTATVYLADGSIQVFGANTNPSSSGYPTVPEGIYHATVGLHKRQYTALRMSDTDNSGLIQLGFPNPAHPNRTYAEGINIHKPGLRNLTGFDSKGNPISAGCLLIDRDKWSDFIDIFNNSEQKGKTVNVTVSRTFSAPVNVNRLPAFNFILNGTRNSFFKNKF